MLVGGEGYAGAYPILLRLAAVGFEPVLMAVHRAGTALLARSAATLSLLATTVVLTSVYGVTGTATAVLVGSLGTTILMRVAAFRSVGPNAR